MIVEDFLSELPETQYNAVGDPNNNNQELNAQDKNKLKMEIKCRRTDIDGYVYEVTGVTYDHDNEVCWIDINRE